MAGWWLTCTNNAVCPPGFPSRCFGRKTPAHLMPRAEFTSVGPKGSSSLPRLMASRIWVIVLRSISLRIKDFLPRPPSAIYPRNRPLTSVFTGVSIGEQKENLAERPDFTPDQPMTPDELAALRLRLSRMSPTALLDAYYAAWTRCKMNRDSKPPPARFIQELVQAWKALRKANSRIPLGE